MRVASIQIRDFRSFVQTDTIHLGPVSVFIGPNNAGKSSVLRALYALQEPSQLNSDVRLGAEMSVIRLDLTDVRGVRAWSDLEIDSGTLWVEAQAQGATRLNVHTPDGREFNVRQLPSREPHHFVVPYLSKRKTAGYAEDVREENAMAVRPDFTHLAAKLSRLGNPGFPGHRSYFDTCNQILGFIVTAVPSANGQRPGTFLEDGQTLPLDQMGEGVPNIVGMLADLALADGKLFLIEEPENDLHPIALKALLDLVVASSERNQMVVSTHSNIVARHLGGAPNSRLYHVDAARGAMPPEATIRRVAATPEARLEVLRELGYSFSDFDLWDGWLILEESSAERIIRDYLIPWFVPKLSRVRTLATAGNQEVEPTFDDFHRLVRFTHLEDAYRNAAWVLIDGDDQGARIIERLRDRYPTWEADRFECLSEAQFESYYPDAFAGRVEAVLGERERQARRQAKHQLLSDVRGWLDEDDARGRAALESSAAPVIEHLRRIEGQLPGLRP